MNANHLQRLRRMLEQVDPSWKPDGLHETLESRKSAAAGPTLELGRRASPGAKQERNSRRRAWT